ncbi:hypothetical protein Plec18170_005939 [Paecilomyces lecythidis]
MAAISIIERATAAGMRGIGGVGGIGGPGVIRPRRHHNWAARNPGVVLVFVIVFIVACGFVALVLYRRWMARKALKAAEAGA